MASEGAGCCWKEPGGLTVSLGGLEPPYHCTDWGCGDTRHSFREQEPGDRCNVGLQSQRHTCCSELEGPKSQAGEPSAGEQGTLGPKTGRPSC